VLAEWFADARAESTPELFSQTSQASWQTVR